MCFSEDDKMEYIVIIIISIITIILLKIGLNVRLKDVKKIKEIGYDKKLKEVADKFPENKEICEDILKKLKNENVQIEENKESKVSLYIAATNKIIIANIKDTFTRIQTIAHECLHSTQNRRILLFNFAFSNILLLYFIVALALILLNIGNSLIYIIVFIFMSIIQYAVRSYLENEAMSKAIYVAKDYMEEYMKKSQESKEKKFQEQNIPEQKSYAKGALENSITEEDIQTITENCEILNKIGIPLTSFYIIFTSVVKIIILCVGAIV